MLVSIDPPGLFAKPAQWQRFVAEMEQHVAEGHDDARPWLEWGRKHLGTHDYDPGQPRRAPGEISPHGGEFASEPGFSDDDARNLAKFSLLERAPEAKGARNVGEIARSLDRRTQTTLRELGVRGGKLTLDNRSARTDDLLAKTIAQETKDELSKSGNAQDWYTRKMDEAVNVFALDHPEVKTDAAARSAFAAALAITSQGEIVTRSAELTEQAYKYFREHGRFNTEEIASAGSIQMLNNFKKYNALLDKLGPQGTVDFLKAKTTVRELNEQGWKVSSLPKDAQVYGSAIFGPKIGNGFYQNLVGNYEPTTQDMWFMRTWGRLTGTLKDIVTTTAGVDKQYERFTKALKADGERKIPDNRNALNSMARDIYSQHERTYAQHADEYRSGERVKSETVAAAERIVVRLDGVNDDADGGAVRLWRESVMAKARDELAKDGIKLTAADLQATIWYPEKTLWEHLGSKGARDGLADYSSAFQRLAKRKGHSDSEIQGALAR